MSEPIKAAEETPPPPLLAAPSGGVPPVIDAPDALAEFVEQLRAADGPIAADAERASGFRYGQGTYLIQLKRGAGPIGLIDPITLDLTALAEVANSAEWIVHSAGGDLPSLALLGLAPASLFDTELAARLLGWEGVGLAAVTERVAGVRLAKEHSAVDWSTRPLLVSWLTYAALDVELLAEIRAAQEEELIAAGKIEWARQEFEALRTAPPPPPRPDPWRRTSGMHAVRDGRGYAIVRSLWQARDALARQRDRAPGRVLPDSAIVAAAGAGPRTAADLLRIPGFNGKSTRRLAGTWLAAIDEAMALPQSDLPPHRGPGGDGPPPPKAWASRNPDAAVRLDAARVVLSATSERVHTPVENLLQPDLLRRLAWDPPHPASAASVSERLLAGGARRWQTDLLAASLAASFTT